MKISKSVTASPVDTVMSSRSTNNAMITIGSTNKNDGDNCIKSSSLRTQSTYQDSVTACDDDDDDYDNDNDNCEFNEEEENHKESTVTVACADHTASITETAKRNASSSSSLQPSNSSSSFSYSSSSSNENRHPSSRDHPRQSPSKIITRTTQLSKPSPSLRSTNPSEPVSMIKKQPNRSSLKTSPSQSNNQSNNRSSKSEPKLFKIRLPGRTQPVTRSRWIKFNERVHMKLIPNYKNNCIANKIWLQPDEFESIEQRSVALIHAVQENKKISSKYCMRGLERYLNFQNVRDVRSEALYTVLDEQELQRHFKSFNSDRLSQAYYDCTQRSRWEAIERAKQDEIAVKRYTHKIRQLCQEHGLLS